MNNIINTIKDKINKGEEISPFLFIGKNLEILNSQITEIWKDLLNEFQIPNVYLYKLEDNNEKIKIKEVKSFIEHSNSTVPYKFQIFFIENISRLTIASSNSLLKFFEEPWVQNIIFISNAWENNILETIISRVQIIDLWWNKLEKNNEFYLSMIHSYLNNNSNEIISYFFKNKLEKDEYINFLENLILYSKKHFCFIDYISEINDEISLIKQNNVNAKYIVDKWLLKIK